MEITRVLSTYTPAMEVADDTLNSSLVVLHKGLLMANGYMKDNQLKSVELRARVSHHQGWLHTLFFSVQ
jgi:hypothetical protein